MAHNSVKSSSIKNGQVKNADLATSSVTSAKVRNGSLVAGDTAFTKRIAFSAQDCTALSAPNCHASVSIGSGITLGVECYYQTGINMFVNGTGSPAGAGVNYSLVENEPATPTNNRTITDGKVLDGNPILQLPDGFTPSGANEIGTMVFSRPGGPVITLPFHLYVHEGSLATNVNCVFEGTATAA